MPTYGRLPVTFQKGLGAWLWDTDGNQYLDALSGIAVCNLGHAHPAVHKAICKQSEQLIHTSNLYGIATQESLSEHLIRLSGMDNVFFCNSGTEANEAAIKLARQYGHQCGIETPRILVTHNSFHGRTMGALSATGNDKIHQGFTPLLSGFVHVPYNDIGAINTAINEHQDIVAILVEPVQGEGGVNIPASDYLNRIRRICNDNQLLMMLDEVQTGIGRTGEFLAYQHNDITPDVCTLAKALGNGVPIGACLAKGQAAEVLSAGQHGSTFGGNPLACSAALAVLDTLKEGQWTSQAQIKGKKIKNAFTEQLDNCDHVIEIRNKGLMIGIDLAAPCAGLVKRSLLEAKLLINVTAENTIRLLPPLIIDDDQINLMVEQLSNLILTHTFE